jgi:hypothetical protein
VDGLRIGKSNPENSRDAGKRQAGCGVRQVFAEPRMVGHGRRSCWLMDTRIERLIRV